LRAGGRIAGIAFKLELNECLGATSSEPWWFIGKYDAKTYVASVLKRAVSVDRYELPACRAWPMAVYSFIRSRPECGAAVPVPGGNGRAAKPYFCGASRAGIPLAQV
jgi:hypothetical protein